MTEVERRGVAARFARDICGAALVEFAMIMPFMVALYFGLVAVTAGYSTSRKVALVARTATDLTARAPTLGCTEVGGIFAAATSIFAPHNATGMNMVLAGVTVTNIGTSSAPVLQAKVTWSQARRISNASGTLAAGTIPSGWAVNTVINPIPSGFAVAGSTYFMGRADKDYSAVVGSTLIGGTHTFTHGFNWPARNSTPVPWSGTTAC
jgi:Flp pilus assembly protein TadG